MKKKTTVKPAVKKPAPPPPVKIPVVLTVEEETQRVHKMVEAQERARQIRKKRS